jgi:hypothetical protein
MIRLDAEAICDQCHAKARCTVDSDWLVSRRISSPGEAMHGLPGWYFKKTTGGSIFCEPSLACSDNCMAALKKYTEESYPGEWKRCQE